MVFYHQIIIGLSGSNFPIIQFYDKMGLGMRYSTTVLSNKDWISHKSMMLTYQSILVFPYIYIYIQTGIRKCDEFGYDQ